MGVAATRDRIARVSTHQVLGTSAVGAATVAFGTGPVIATLVTVPALTVVSLRFVLAAPLMAVVLLVTRRRLTMRDVRRSLPGGVLLPVQVLLFYVAARETSVADVTFIMALQPVLVFTLAPRLFGERITWQLAACGGLGIGGVALVVYGSSRGGIAHPVGELIAVANLIVWTAYLLVSKWARSDGRVDALQYQACVNGIGAVVMLVPLFLAPHIAGASTGDWLGIFYLTVVPGVLAHVLNSWAQRYVDQSVGSIILLAQPVVATIGAAPLLHEPVGPLSVLGGLCVLAAAGTLMRPTA